MSAEIPTTEPTTITKGMTTQWTKTLDNYPATLWNLKYRLTGVTTNVQIGPISSVASGTDHAVTLSVAVTEGVAWVVGNYNLRSWVVSIADPTIKHELPTTLVEVLPDPTSSTGIDDTRTHAKKCLDAINAMMEGNASREEMSLNIQGGGISRQVGFCSKEDLIYFHRYYSQLCAAETSGGALGRRKILTRYVNP